MSNMRRIGPGRLILVVGPSGAGKDTLIAGAKATLPGDPTVAFPRRVVTRASGSSEDHDTLTSADFDRAVRAGAFSLHWEAHGLKYGIPKHIDDLVAAGHTVVCNVSRTIIGPARERYANVTTVLVTAPPDILARRLAGRRRASDGCLADRIKRQAGTIISADIVINNIDTETVGVNELIQTIKHGA